MTDHHHEAQDSHSRLEVAVRSILSPTGRGRTENQDNYLIIDTQGGARYLRDQREASSPVSGWAAGHMRLAVLDGLGGHSRGREAAEKTVEGLLRVPAATDAHALAQDLEALHTRLHREMHGSSGAPGCTLTMLELPPSGPSLLFHAGDSRLYAIDAGNAQCLTIDHVPATQLAMLDLLDEAQWTRQVFEEPGSLLCQAFVLGNTLAHAALASGTLNEDLLELRDDNLPPFLRGRGDRRPIPLEGERVYLLASDGLWHLSRPMEFIRRWPQILARPDKPLAGLVDDLFEALSSATTVEKHLADDNSTAIAFRTRR